MSEVEITIRRAILARLNQMATDWLGSDIQRMFAMGQWTGMLNKIDPDSPHCVLDDREAETWSEKAIIYLKGYKHGLESATHKESASA